MNGHTVPNALPTYYSVVGARWPLAFPAPGSTRRALPRELPSRPCRAVATAARHHAFGATVPVPAPLRSSASAASSVHVVDGAARWTLRGGPIASFTHAAGLVQTFVEDILFEPVAWVLGLVRQLQAALLRLISGGRENIAQPASAPAVPSATGAALSKAQSRAAQAAISAPSAPNKQLPPGRKKGAATEQLSSSSSAPTVLVAAPSVTPTSSPRVPVVALAVTAAAALVCVGVWALKRWRTAMKAKREMEQRIAVKRESLVRQKQRFQRALSVDSVNVELPAIKELDVQPDPVRVEHVLSQRAGPAQSRRAAPQPLNSIPLPLPSFGDDSRRQWEQFMAASRATEVTNVSGSKPRGSRGKVENDDARPYDSLDDRMLADLSERIRRANEAGASGAAASAPVITFEQLYASNTETDDEAMARRAAERKARWQQKHAAAPVPSTSRPRSVDVPQASVDEKHVTVPPPVPSKPRPRPPPRPDPSSNPFLQGLNIGSPQSSTPSSPGPRTSNVAGAGLQPKASPESPRVAGSAQADDNACSTRASMGDSGVAGRLTAGDRMPELSSGSAAGLSHRAVPSTSGVRAASLDQGPLELPEAWRPEHLSSGGSMSSHSEAEPGHEVTIAASSLNTDTGDEQRQQHAVAGAAEDPHTEELAAAPTRVRRAAPAGALRTPDASDPSLVRLMRRPVSH